MTIRKILVVLVKTLMWGGIAVALLYGALLLINVADENRTPETESLLAVHQIESDPTNGFLALVGSTMAPVDEDFVEYGRQWVDAYQAAADQAAFDKAAARFSGGGIKFKGDEKLLCDPTMALCLPQAAKHAAVWRKFAADNKMMLARQHRLLEFVRFEDNYLPAGYASPIPSLAGQFRLLALDMIALDAAAGRIEPALTALEARIAFDRRALSGSGSVLMAMRATAWLRQDYALLAEIVATHPKVISVQKARLMRMTQPLEIAQMSTIAGRMVTREFQYILRSPEWDESPELMMGAGLLPDAMRKPLFKIQATKNEIAHFHKDALAWVGEYSPENAEASVGKYRRKGQSQCEGLTHSWRVLYNPVGKHLVCEGLPVYDSYVLRLSDVIGIMRLARLQIEVASVARNADISALITADKTLYDPYTGKPIGWDAGKRQLYFDKRGDVQKGESKRVQVGV